MSIVNKIKTSVQTITGLPCYYDDSGRLNMKLDYLEYPLAFFTLINNGNLNTTNAHYRERVDIAMFFIKPTTFDFESLENEQIIEECKGYALKWLQGLRLQRDLIPLYVLNTTRVYNYADTILTGYAINIRLEETIGEACFGPLTTAKLVSVNILPVSNAGVVLGAGKYAKDALVELTATESNPQYRFNNWTDSDSQVVSSTLTYSFTMGDEDVALNANYLENPYLTINISPLASGTVSGDGYNVPGASVSLVAEPLETTYFIKWTDEEDTTISTNPTYTYTMPSEDTVLFAYFGNKNHVSIGTHTNGTVSGDGYFGPLDNCTLTAIPDEGYMFKEYQVEGQQLTTSNPYTFLPTGDITIDALFVPAWTVETSVSPANSGTVNGAGVYEDGTNATLTATPDSAYVFYEWQTPEGVSVGNVNPYTFQVDANTSLVAVFIPKYNVSATVNPQGAGSVSGTGLVAPGDSCTLVATANTNYAFSEWQDTSGTTLSSNASYTFTPVADTEVVAVFVETRSISITVSPSGYGTVSGGGDLPVGSTATITATPASGKKFKQWEID